ncbi:MAG: family 78 glycoside hydrolase catalytic domain [Bacteroidota bacterium]
MKTIFKIFILSLLATACKEQPQMNITNLRCEQRIDPLGLDIHKPHLSWVLESNRRGAKQKAYHILVASSLKKLNTNTGDIWDSKKIVSQQTSQIEYKGETLLSEMEYYWKVRVWDEHGVESVWSEPSTWEMGLIHQSDWSAQWINDGGDVAENREASFGDDPAPLFRRDFNLPKKIKKARLYITGVGYYEATINGERVGDHLLDPGWTDFSKRVLYSTYNVTGLIKNGGNSMGVTLGNGWYNPLPLKMWGVYNLREHLTIGQPQFIAQLNIEYTDGSTQTIGSNEEWKTHEGPILRNNIYLGEIYDARKEIEGWDSFGFDDRHWNVAKISEEKLGKLQAQNQPPIKITGKLSPVKLTEPKPGVYIFDMGQNFAGWAKLKVEASAGTRIKLRFGELLYEDGTLNGLTSVAGQIKGKKADGTLIGGTFSPDTAWQSDTYITSGKGIETYTPRFTFHSFRYVEVTGFPGKPPMDAIEGFRLSSDLQKRGSFECSNKLFNDIQKITEWTFLSNVFSVQSDCPHREKFGYGGDIAVTSDAFIYNFDMTGFYAKAVRDFQDAARPNGMFTDTAPFVGINYCGIAWALAHPLLLLELYQYYGDISLIEEQYETARKWFELVISENDLIITHGLSDHESLAPIPTSEMVTPLYYKSAVMMSELAKIMDRKDDAARYDNLAKEIKEAYLEKFLEKGDGRFAPHTQGSQSFVLYTGLAPKNETENAVSELVKNIEDHDGHLTTGIFGTKYSLDVLSKYGYAEIASEMVSQEGFPGWANMLANGATTLWEHWEFSDHIYSHNHPMFGSVSEWFYKWVAGIQADPSAVGFDKIIIRPQIISDVNWVKAHYTSVHGKIISEWKRDDNSFNLDITIPVNSTATVYLPAEDVIEIKEGGVDISGVKDVEFLKMENHAAVFNVGSGFYSFKSQIK